jgi:hypothetical protein
MYMYIYIHVSVELVDILPDGPLTAASCNFLRVRANRRSFSSLLSDSGTYRPLQEFTNH